MANAEYFFKMIEQLTLSMRHCTESDHRPHQQYIKYFFWVTKHIARNQTKLLSKNVSGSYELEIITLEVQLLHV